jgi:hypothetical protein
MIPTGKAILLQCGKSPKATNRHPDMFSGLPASSAGDSPVFLYQHTVIASC